MVDFFVGIMVGMILGVTIFALCTVACDDDE